MRLTLARLVRAPLVVLISASSVLLTLGMTPPVLAWSNSPTVNTPVDTTVETATNDWEVLADGSGGFYLARSFGSPADTLIIRRFGTSGEPKVGWPAGGTPIVRSAGTGSALLLPGFAGGLSLVYGIGRHYFQAVSSLGVPAFSSPGVPVHAFRPFVVYDEPLVQSDQAGGAVVAWSDPVSAAKHPIYLQRVDSSGSLPWGVDGIRVSDTTYVTSSDALAYDGSGGAIVCWTSPAVAPPNNNQLHIQRVNASGVALWQSLGELIYASDRRDYVTAVMADGSGGAYLAWNRTWTNQATSNEVSYLHFGHVRPDGTTDPVWPDSGLTIVDARLTSRPFASLIPSASGELIAYWQNGNYQAFARISSGGALRWLQPQASDPSPVVVADGHGGAWWTAPRGTFQGSSGGYSNFDMYASHMTASGAVDLAALPIGIGPGGQFGGPACSDSAGGMLVIWGDTRYSPNESNNCQLYGQNVNANFTLGGTVVATDAALVAADADADGVTLRWNVPSSQPAYQLQRREVKGAWSARGTVSFADGSRQLVIADRDVVPGGIYEYRLSWQESGATRYSSAVTVTIPSAAAFSLALIDQPGPGPGASIRYSLARADRVTLTIHDVTGRRVRALSWLDGAQGSHMVRWDGRDESGSLTPPGLYFVRLQASEGVRVSRLTIAR